MNDEVTLSVSQYFDAMNEVVKASQGKGVWVQGEIEGFKPSNQHTYFNVVERRDDVNAVLNVAIWAYQMKAIKSLLDQHRLELANGIKVRIFGYGDFYQQRGTYTFKASKIDPRFTLGDLAGQRDEIIRRLKTNGLYDANRTTSLPLVPMNLAVVTSVGSAAHADTMSELTKSGIGFDVRVFDTRVQGDDAIPSLVRAIRAADHHPTTEVILLVRGGGSRTDLLAFDAEDVATAIAKCTKPVLTGIGHETDTSIADEVANLRFKTPTACAAHVVQLVKNFISRTEETWSNIATRSLTELQRAEHQLVLSSERIRQRPREALRSAEQHLIHATSRLRLLDPVNTMKRGWSIVRAQDGSVVRSTSGVKTGSSLTIQMSDGSVSADVSSVQSSKSRKGG